MSSRRILDSSPIRASGEASGSGEPQRKSLKRSASTASLLTPPQTIARKDRYARSRSRGSERSERDTDVDTDSDEEEERVKTKLAGLLQLGNKRQRTGRLDAVAAQLTGDDAENPFWDGETKAQGSSEGVEGVRERSTTPPVVRFRRNKAPVSPPPSKRKSSSKTALPKTPKSKRVQDDDGPVRDSPNNPFLDDSPLSVADDASPKTPQEHEEKPMVTYVFRGVRTTFANPHYNLSPSVRERALLPEDHPDFSPNPACPPKMLFADARKRTRSASPTRKRTKVLDRVAKAKHKTDDEWDDDESTGLHVELPKRLF